MNKVIYLIIMFLFVTTLVYAGPRSKHNLTSLSNITVNSTVNVNEEEITIPIYKQAVTDTGDTVTIKSSEIKTTRVKLEAQKEALQKEIDVIDSLLNKVEVINSSRNIIK